jgi:hypothetical protein
MMDPLQELWDLLEDVPALQAAPTPFIGTPENNTFETEHPVTQQRRAIDMLRKQGMSAAQAHEAVYGEIDLSDTEAKRDLATTMGRVQDDGNKKGVRIDMDAQFPSIMANDQKMTMATNQTTVDDLRTPMNKQVPDIVQDPEAGQQPEQPQMEEVELQEEFDYNWDVAYLQKYGRA